MYFAFEKHENADRLTLDRLSSVNGKKFREKIVAADLERNLKYRLRLVFSFPVFPVNKIVN